MNTEIKTIKQFVTISIVFIILINVLLNTNQALANENNEQSEDQITTDAIISESYEPQPTTMEETSTKKSDIIISSGNATDLYDSIQNAPEGNTTITISNDINLNSLNYEVRDNKSESNLSIHAAIVIPRNKSITITSDNNSKLIKSNQIGSTNRHFAVKGTLTLQSITLTGEGAAGGVEVILGSNTISGGTFFMEKDVVIENCYSISQGGGVQVGAYASFTMNGGEIKNCITNSSSGGGVSVYGQGYGSQDSFGIANFIMNNGTISGNQALNSNGNQGGAGLLVSAANVTMNGGTITGNMTSGSGGGVRIVCRPTQLISSHFTMNGGTISDNQAATEGSGVLVLGQGPGEDGSGASFTMNAGTISGNLTAGNGGGAAVMEAYSSFAMKKEKGASIIIENAADSRGGGVYVDNGIFELDGGIIDSNRAANGAGVFVSAANVTMNSGTITRNESSGSGAGIYIYCSSSQTIATGFTMNSGAISDNTSISRGGGAMVVGQSAVGSFLTINSGTISGNKASGNGGGVCVYDTYAVLNMNTENGDSTIIDNTGLNGGGVFVDNSTFNLSSGAVSANKTQTGNGGGVYVTGGSNLTMGEARIFANSASAGDGGGIYTETATYLGTGDYVNLNIAETAQFSSNKAQASYTYDGIPTAINIASRSASLNFPEGTTPYMTHPLNNYDINYRKGEPLEYYTVAVEYLDIAGIELLPPITSLFLKDTNYTYTVPAINGYELVDWKWNQNYQSSTDPLTSFPVTGNTTITLIYQLVIPFSFYKVDAVDYITTLPDSKFELYSWVGEEAPEDMVTNENKDSGWKLKGLYVSNNIGYVDLGNIAAGSAYQLVEVKAPFGYQLPMGQWRIIVNGDGTISDPAAMGSHKPPAFKNAGTDEVPVYLLGNVKQFTIPLAGGKGTYWSVTLGGLMLMAGVLLKSIQHHHRFNRAVPLRKYWNRKKKFSYYKRNI